MTISSHSRGPEARWAGARNPWVICPLPRPEAHLRLFCIPAAGEGPAAFRTWPEQFSDVEVCLVRLPGRERRFGEQAYSQMDPLLDALIPAIAPLLDRSYAFFGHSLGGLIEFEATRRLIKQQLRAPLHLFVSGYPAPHLARPATTLNLLPNNDALREALRRDGGTPRELLDHPELLEVLLPMLRADIALSETYHYQEGKRLPCPIRVFGGDADQKVPIETLYAWQQQTAASCTVRVFSGDHFFLHHHLPQMVEDIMEYLRQSVLLQLVTASGGK